MGEHTPLADRLGAEVDAFFRLWKNRRWLTVILLLFVVGTGIVSIVGWFRRGSQIETLKSESRELERDIRQLESENKSLRETVAPLITRAAKEFPGEEINTSLKKIVNRLEKQNPRKQPIASATATVVLTVQSDDNVDAHFMDRGGYVIFGKGSSSLLQASSHESWGHQTGKGAVRYRGIFTMPAEGIKPLEYNNWAHL